MYFSIKGKSGDGLYTSVLEVSQVIEYDSPF